MNLLTKLANLAEAQMGLQKIDNMEYKVLVQYEKGQGINPFTKERLKGDGEVFIDSYHSKTAGFSKEEVVVCSKNEASIVMTGNEFEEVLKEEEEEKR